MTNILDYFFLEVMSETRKIVIILIKNPGTRAGTDLIIKGHISAVKIPTNNPARAPYLLARR